MPNDSTFPTWIGIEDAITVDIIVNLSVFLRRACPLDLDSPRILHPHLHDNEPRGRSFHGPACHHGAGATPLHCTGS